MPTFRQDLHIGTKIPLINGDDISDGAITSEKISDELWNEISNANFAAIPNEDIDELAPFDENSSSITLAPLNGLLAKLNAVDLPDEGTYAIAIDKDHSVSLSVSDAMPESEVLRILGI